MSVAQSTWNRITTRLPITFGDNRFNDQLRSRTQALRNESDESLRKRTDDLRHFAVHRAGTCQRLLRSTGFIQDAFSLIGESVRRTTGKSFYPVQIQAGRGLVLGSAVEMQTGEGKTLTTALPAFTFALFGRGVHVATTNHYLAERDCEELRAALESLGISVGLLPSTHDALAKINAYRCDVTFGTGYEFGFDFLRDQITLRGSERRPLGKAVADRLGGFNRSTRLLQRGHHFAIVDEADSVLIDEATMPLVLSMSASQPPAHALLQLAARTAEQLQEDVDYELSVTERKIEFTQQGLETLFECLVNERTLGMKRPWKVYVEQALRASLILKRDVDYVVNEDEIQIVDQHTGRIHPERTWRDGLHQAVEFHQGAAITAEREVEGRVSRQRYFQFYDHVCGMTGTTTGVESEFRAFYRMPVTKVPTHRGCLRQYEPTMILSSNDDRNAAILRQIQQRRQTGQPILVGTRTILHSKQLSQILLANGIAHSLLNGVQDEKEAHLVSLAGKFGTVTIATNMAGRGTDIKPDKRSIQAGGLCVIGSEHNLTRRVDRQLAGRSARQGQPGCAMFFAALTDELFQHAEPRLQHQIASAIKTENGRTDRFDDSIAALQAKLEVEHFHRRKTMVQSDRWMEQVLESLAKTARN